MKNATSSLSLLGKTRQRRDDDNAGGFSQCSVRSSSPWQPAQARLAPVSRPKAHITHPSKWPFLRHTRQQFGVSQPGAAGSPRFQMNHGVLRQEMRGTFVFTVFFHCLWVWKGRTDVSKQVYRLGRGPWPRNRVGFGVSQAAGSPRFQISRLLRRSADFYLCIVL